MKLPFKNNLRVSIITIAALFTFLYFEVFRELLVVWSTVPDYSHGYLIPFLALYLVWGTRDKIITAHLSPSFWGLVVFIIGIGQYIIGYIGAEHFMQGTSMIFVILGIVLFLWGREVTRIVLVPVCYLMFMIPLPAIIWNKFAFSLKLYATEIAVYFIQAVGITVLREGNVLTLPATTLEVVDACSGLRSLISLLALTALTGYISNVNFWKKWVLFISAIPIAIASNIIRLIITAVLFDKFGIDITQGISHTLSGLFVFSIGIALFIIVYKILMLIPKQRQKDAV